MATGSDIVIEVLRSENVSYVFGNPGTTELALVDALSQQNEIKYVLGLQEATVVGLADGYARATNRPSFVNLHATAGLGNGLGAISNAAYMNTPMVVTAGQQDYRHIVDDPWLTGDLVGLAKPLCKWAHEVRTVDELGTILRRAFKDANSYPKGPVFVALPSNFMEQETSAVVPPKTALFAAPVSEGIAELAEELAECGVNDLAIVAGDEVSASQAMDELIALAEGLGADVYGSALHDSVVFPSLHPLWCGSLKPLTSDINARLEPYKKVLVLGARGFMAYAYSPDSPVPRNTDILHLSADSLAVAMTFAAKWGGVGDIKNSIQALLGVVKIPDSNTLTDKLARCAEQQQAKWQQQREQYQAALAELPIKPSTAAYGLVNAMPDNAIVVDEAPATMWAIRESFNTRSAGQYHFSKGGGLGWAMPAAVGISLANREVRTYCLIGDGAAMYSPQALWSAANQGLPVTYVVFNNAEYGVLKKYLRNTIPSNAERDDFIGMDLNTPNVDYLALGTSMGIPGVRVEHAGDIGAAVEQLGTFAHAGPSLIEIMIAPSIQV